MTPAARHQSGANLYGIGSSSEEQEALSALLGISLPAMGVSSVDSKISRLGDGYTERIKWTRARRRFARVVEGTESNYGREGVKYCFVHFFLDVVHHGQVIAQAAGPQRVLLDRVWMTPQDDARLELLLAVQENFPEYQNVAEELVVQLKEREREVRSLLSHSTPRLGSVRRARF